MEYDSALKRKAILTHASTLVEDIMISEARHKRTTYLVKVSTVLKIIELEDRKGV